MEREWLAERVAAGEAFESIARQAGVHPSTVSYWARRHGLISAHRDRHAARGTPDADELARLVEAGCSTREIAEALGRSQTSVRHWLSHFGLRTRHARLLEEGPPCDIEQLRYCSRHGTETRHLLRADGAYRCQPCRSAAVTARRRRIKQTLIQEAGGACALCGYARVAAALAFHHVDPKTKRFSISGAGVTRSLDRAREEAQKCVLLCANCHAEVEVGYASLPPA